MLQQRIGELEAKIQTMVALPDYNKEKQQAIEEKRILEEKLAKMKARINVGRKLLIFGVTEEHRSAIMRAARHCGAKSLFTDDPITPICVLLGETTADAVASDSAGHPLPQGECMLIVGFGREELNDALTALTTEGVRIPLKAVYTQVNRVWSFAHLADELAAEHEYMTRRTGGDKL